MKEAGDPGMYCTPPSLSQPAVRIVAIAVDCCMSLDGKYLFAILGLPAVIW